MDRASVLGIVSGFILLLWGMSNGGDLRMFWDFASVLITVGGTLTATLISYRLSTFLEVMSIAKNAFVSQEQDISETINTIVRFADKARREGLLALDQDADALDDPFLQKGIRLVVDGTTPELVRNILETELAFIANLVFLPIANKLKNKSAAEIFRKEAIIEGVLSIQAGDNPRIVQEKLKSFVSPKKRSEIQMPSRLREVPGSEIPLDVR